MPDSRTSGGPRRHRALLAIVALLSLLLLIRIRGDTAWLGALLNATHAPIFAVVSVFIFELLDLRTQRALSEAWPGWPRIGRALAIAVALGVLIEFLQYFEGRPPSLFDVGTDLAGGVVGLAAWSVWRRGRLQPPPRGSAGGWVLATIALVALAYILWRPIEAARAYAHRAAEFPTIAEFRKPLDLYFLSGEGEAGEIAEMPAPWSRSPGEKALRIRSSVEHGAAVQILEPTADWRGYSVVAVDLTNPSSRPAGLTFRILDAHHDWSDEDRLNLPVVVPARTRTTLRVALSEVQEAPARRLMDMSAIANVMLFSQRAGHPVELYVSRIWLE